MKIGGAGEAPLWGGKKLPSILVEMMFLLKTLHIKMHKTHLLIPSPQNHLCSFIPDKNTI
jgi:hypothetical protein